MASLRNGYLALYRKVEICDEIKVEKKPEHWYFFNQITETKQGFTIYRDGKKPTFVPKWFNSYEYRILWEL